MKHRYIFRLDDACPQMNVDNWDRIEKLLDAYGIKPIVGIIPDNKDSFFGNGYYERFWERALEWKNKGWTIAQHGLHHLIKEADTRTCFQKVVEKDSEFVGRSLSEQKEMLLRGYEIMKQKCCEPTCFFAPCHTFDSVTVEAVKELGLYDFISDGYSAHAYKKNGVVFIPWMFDAPHKLRGVQTFISHPNFLTDEDYRIFEDFFIKYKHDFIVPADLLADKNNIKNSQGLYGKIAERVIYCIRKLR
ncbi:MAG: DUF2334 domain-containing protein [Clostridia bacterium]|nr:DUF2334 domain-containing protein [Clostridia bacterium]